MTQGRSIALSLLLLACCQLCWSAQLPQELVGTWATPDSEFDGDHLIGGTALFVLPGGQIAIVGAPLPVRRDAEGRFYAPIIGVAGTATYDQKVQRLAITLRDGQKQMEGVGNYLDADDVVELIEPPDKKVRLVHRSKLAPAWLQAKFDAAKPQPTNDPSP